VPAKGQKGTDFHQPSISSPSTPANTAPRTHPEPGSHQRPLPHSWPGNIRELENTLGGAALLAGGGRIEAHHLSFSHRAMPTPTSVPTSGSADSHAGPVWLEVRQQLLRLLDRDQPELLAQWEALLVETSLTRQLSAEAANRAMQKELKRPARHSTTRRAKRLGLCIS